MSDSSGGTGSAEVALDAAQARLVAELTQRYRPVLARFFQKRVPADADVDAWIQEVFSRLIRKTDLTQAAQVEGYIFQAATSLLREHGRKLGARAPLEPGKDSIAQVLAALQELPERSRHAFILYRFEDLRHNEIARRLKISAGTVEKDVMRALAHLLRRVGRYG